MSGFRIRRALPCALALAVAVPAVVPAVAATPRRATVTAVGGPKYVINRLAGDTMRFNKDTYAIRSGGTLTIRNRTREPHTLSVVRRSQLPRTRRQLDRCSICEAIGVAHGVPQGGGPPARPVVDPDGKGLNQAGDSISFGDGSVRVKVTARAGRTLRFLCALHPWMQAKLRVR